jgi:hypothetical protein
MLDGAATALAFLGWTKTVARLFAAAERHRQHTQFFPLDPA